MSRLQRLWEQLSRGSRGSGGGHLDAPEARRAPISTLQRLQEHPSRGSRGSGSGHREAPEALGAAISRLQRLSRPKWFQPQFYRVFSTILEPGDLLGSSPNGSGRLEETFQRLRAGSRGLLGVFEWLRERSEVASRRVKRLRVALGALEEFLGTTANQRDSSQINSKVLWTGSSMD